MTAFLATIGLIVAGILVGLVVFVVIASVIIGIKADLGEDE